MNSTINSVGTCSTFFASTHLMNNIEKQRFFDLNREVRNTWNAYFEINQLVLCPSHSPELIEDLQHSWDAFRYSSANLDSFIQHINGQENEDA